MLPGDAALPTGDAHLTGDALSTGDALLPTGDALLPTGDALLPTGDALLPPPPGDAALPPPGPDAALPPPPVPLNLPVGQWSALLIDGMTCADGTPTGVAVNPGPPGTHRVFIYLMGGGACWDEDTCYDHPRASNIAQPALPQAFLGSDLPRLWFFDRAARPNGADNPFADHHLVWVPYCTGDVHAGNRVAHYGGRPTRHVGAANFAALASRLSAAWPETDRVALSGGSAGGYGSVLNWQRALDAFPRARVDVVDDSGPPFPPPELAPGLLALWSAAWGLPDTVPRDCAPCANDLSAHVAHGLAHPRSGRMGLLSSTGDAVIASYLNVDAAGITRGLVALQAAAPPGFGAFVVEGDAHVLMAGQWVAGGLTIPVWIRMLLDDDPAWGTVGPSPQPACDARADCAECAVCAAEGPCAAELEACQRVEGCVETVVCGLGCNAADQGCLVACAAAHPGVGQETLDLYACARCESCPARCGACP